MPGESPVFRLIPPNQPGRTIECKVTFVGEPWRDGSVRYERGRTAFGTEVCVKTAVSGSAEAGDQLKQERRVLERLDRSFPGDSYPDQLVRLVGADLGAESPCLITTFDGEALDRMPHEVRFQPDSIQSAIDSLVLGLRYLDSARVVCRSIRPSSLAWDGSSLSITDFRWAAFAGNPRMPRVQHGYWSSPEQRNGEGVTDCRDDVYGVAQAILHIATGMDVGEAADMRDRLRAQEPELVRLLDSAFADAAFRRPTPLDLLRRRGLDDPCPPSASGAGSERENQARARFRDLRDQQFSFLKTRQEQREYQADRQRREEQAAFLRWQAEQRRRQEEFARQERRRRLLFYGKAGGLAAALVTLTLVVLNFTGVI